MKQQTDHQIFKITKLKSFGFTLIELLVVITIIGILAGLALTSYSGAQARSRDARRKQDLAAIKKALQLAKQDTPGAYYYPKCDTGSVCYLSDNSTDFNLATTYIKKVPTDPKTGQGYRYEPLSGIDCSMNGRCTNYNLRTCLENANDSQKDSSKSSYCTAFP